MLVWASCPGRRLCCRPTGVSLVVWRGESGHCHTRRPAAHAGRLWWSCEHAHHNDHDLL